MVRDIFCLNLVDIVIDNTSSAKILLIDHGCMLHLGSRFPLVGPDGLEEISVGPVKANSETSDTGK